VDFIFAMVSVVVSIDISVVTLIRNHRHLWVAWNGYHWRLNVL